MSLNRFMGTGTDYKPQAGDGATFLMWSDRRPGVITKVSKSGKSVWVGPVSYKLVSGSTLSESQEYEFGTEPLHPGSEYTLRKNGQWVRKGSPMRGGSRVALGWQDAYTDPTF